MAILVTGGAGYIGSHTAVELLKKNYDVILVDDFSNSSIDTISRMEKLTNKNIHFYNISLQDKLALEQVFVKHDINSIVHFAGYKSVNESVQNPLKYYTNNIISTLNLCELMDNYNVCKLIFSSSATVYGIQESLPITECSPTSVLNPYGRTKLMIEEILTDLAISNNKWKIVCLRYFNPVGAHPSGLIGEKPNETPNNLMPYIIQVAIGKLKELEIFGQDYPTIDGTGVRDYIHVVDLAIGHLKALSYIDYINGIDFFNLGTGKGYSVLEVIKTFEEANGTKIPYKFTDRRLGDVAISYADPTKALEKLNWKAKKDLLDMCKDAWRWGKQFKIT